MKKSTKILSFILVCLSIVVIKGMCKQSVNTKSILIKDIDYKMNRPGTGSDNRTTYYDFSKLKSLESEYSHSSLKYMEDTKFELLNRKKEGFTIYYHKLSSELHYSGEQNKGFNLYIGKDEENPNNVFQIANSYRANPKILIQNCATDENNKKLDVIIELSNYKSYSSTTYNGVMIQTGLSITQELEPNRPLKSPGDDGGNLPRTENYLPHTIGSPITFLLYAYGAEILYTMTYYYHPEDGYQKTNSGDYIYDISKLEKAGITKVNGYYYDIDIDNRNGNDNNRPTIFNGPGSKSKYEGINPYLDSGEKANIYYNKDREAKIYGSNWGRRNDTDWRKVYLAQDNGGIRIDGYENYSSTTGNYNINSAWYGTSAFMTNYNLKESRMRFMYGGNGCGINYGFLSPVQYQLSEPVKKISKMEVNEDGSGRKVIQESELVDKINAGRGEEFVYDVSQFIPDNYSTGQLNFDKVYQDTTSVYTPHVYLSNFTFEDKINNNLDILQENGNWKIKVYREEDDVTDKFDISVNSNNVVRASLKESLKKYMSGDNTNKWFTDKEFYNKVYRIKIYTSMKNSPITTSLSTIIDNKVGNIEIAEHVINNPNAVYIENTNEIILKNIARTYIKVGGTPQVANYSNIVSVRALPEIVHNITKTADNEAVTDLEERITYTINYSATIENYIGDVDLEYTDALPYTAKQLDDIGYNGKVEDDKKRITWNETKSVNTTQNNKLEPVTIQWSKTFSVIYADMDIEAKREFTNYVMGDIKPKTPEREITPTIGSCTTKQNFIINIDVTKLWEDTAEMAHKRPQIVRFLILQNGDAKIKNYNGTEESSIKTLEPNDKVLFVGLPKYYYIKDNESVVVTENGNDKIAHNDVKDCVYTVREITKMVVKDNKGIAYGLNEIKGDLIQSEDDLSYFMNDESEQNIQLTDDALKQDRITPGRWEDSTADGRKNLYIKFINRYSSVNIKGNVWKDKVIDGIKSNEQGFKGVEVRIFYQRFNIKTLEYENQYLGITTRTDENGNYEFNDIPWNGAYKLLFAYNGQVYETTYYKNDIESKVYSNIKEIYQERDAINNKFATISAYPNNYDTNKRAFGAQQKIKNADTDDANYNYILGVTPYTFEDILNIFEQVDLNIKEYNDAFWNQLKNNLLNGGIKETTANKLIEYMQDSIIHAYTPESFSANNLKERLKPGEHKTIELITAGLSRREVNDLSITNDVYKVTSIIDGKVREDGYNTKKELYEVAERKEDGLYNGSQLLNRTLFKSDYLFSGNEIGEDDARNLKVYVTYRIRIKNKGKVSAKINEIVDYYDSNNFETVASIQNLNTFKNNTFLGDEGFNKKGNLGIKETESTLAGHAYNKLTITNDDESALKVYHATTNTIDDILHPEEETDVYITLRVKNNAITNRVPLDTEIKNIAEINKYTTIYTPLDATEIPDELGKNNVRINKSIYNITNAGLVDIDSDPGSLLAQDLDENDNLIYTKTQSGKTYESMEDDTDKIGIKLMISQDDKDIRRIGGYVFEDNRTQVNNNTKTTIGNGYKEDSETGINGVTVQLVQLVPEIDADGIALEGKYKKEVVLGSYVYSRKEDGGLVKTSDNTNDASDNSYYSGNGISKVIESGTNELEVKSKNIGENQGQYRFDSIYPGDFYVRFVYGDTVRTVLTNTNNEVNTLLKDTGLKGLNNKSYNGQDYKSTIYQSGFDNKNQQNFVDQSGNYNGIDGYQRYDTQNYAAITNVKDLGSMYYYDLQKSNDATIDGVHVRLSDAKDIYDDRIKTARYSTDLTNNNAEVMSSFEKLGSGLKGSNQEQIDQQVDMINTAMQQTKMRSNTGVIQLENKHNNDTTKEVDLGLVERPKAQISLTKGVGNIKIVLANGKVLFDTNKSVNNLYFSKHTEHEIVYNRNKIASNPTINRINDKETPELIQAYIDKELMQGAGLQIDYQISARNVGEVDYTDKKYYYTGIEDEPEKNISKTRINKIVDYNSNTTLFDGNDQNKQNNWKTVSADYLLSNNYVTQKYKEELETYQTILVSDGFTKELVPEMFKDKYKKHDSEEAITLTMNASPNTGNILDSLVYNNTIEVIESTNTYGRREAYSIPGNQEITDQRLLSNALRGKSRDDRQVPKEIDADSAQKIGILPPTGQKNYAIYVLIVGFGLVIVIGGVFLIKQLVLKKKENE